MNETDRPEPAPLAPKWRDLGAASSPDQHRQEARRWLRTAERAWENRREEGHLAAVAAAGIAQAHAALALALKP